MSIVATVAHLSGGRGWLAGDTDGLVGWPVTVGVVEMGVVDSRYGVSQPGADAERYRCVFTLGLAGRGDAYQCGLDCERSSTVKCRKRTPFSVDISATVFIAYVNAIHERQTFSDRDTVV